MRTVRLVVDGAISATAIQQLTERIEDATNVPIEQIDLLGRFASVAPDAFHSAESPRLIAPTLEQLQQRRQQVDLLIVAAHGCVFDVADWTHSTRVRRWLFVRMGDEPLQSLGLPECRLAAFETTLNRLDKPRRPLPAPSTSVTSRSAALNWEMDKHGFPFVYMQPLGAFWQLFPLAKPQFERYWLDHPSAYSNEWYQKRLQRNSRCSPRQRNIAQYEQLFLTGLLSSEAVALAEQGGGQLPTVAEWRTAYRWLEEQPAVLPPPDLSNLHPLAREMWEQLYRQVRPKTLNELALMHGGVTEWVRDGDQFAGLGKPRPSFQRTLGNPLTSPPVRPIRPNQRIHHFGMRLML